MQHMQAARSCNLVTRPLAPAAAAVAATCSSRKAVSAHASSNPPQAAPVGTRRTGRGLAGQTARLACAGSSCCSAGISRRMALSCRCSPVNAGAAWPATDAATANCTSTGSSDTSIKGPLLPQQADDASLASSAQQDSMSAQQALPPALEADSSSSSSNGSSTGSSRSAKAVLQPVTYSTGVSLPTQANWQSAVAALRVSLALSQ